MEKQKERKKRNKEEQPDIESAQQYRKMKQKDAIKDRYQSDMLKKRLIDMIQSG